MDPDVARVEVELVDGGTEIATVAVAGRADDPGRLALWAFATEGDVAATVARAEDGTEERIESLAVPGEN